MEVKEFGSDNSIKFYTRTDDEKLLNQFRNVPQAEDHPFEGLGHGEIIAHPDLMAREIEAFMSKEKEI